MLDSEQQNHARELPRGEAIARLNDKLRKTTRGGRIIVTRGVLALPGYSPNQLLHALAHYDRLDALCIT